ncbi:hypothetical protein RB195_001389 [Necator americanus]|uniref:Reverse transcriptase domain-containing protein n=1 Tax=Necator americanus TaxID=51031 RepID=A0ABR1DEH2_NECAM
MLAEFDETCKRIGLQLNLDKTVFMRNGWVSKAPFTLSAGQKDRADWGAFKSIDLVKRTKNIRLRAHLFNATVLPALTYASETWTFRKQEENAVSVI